MFASKYFKPFRRLLIPNQPCLNPTFTLSHSTTKFSAKSSVIKNISIFHVMSRSLHQTVQEKKPSKELQDLIDQHGPNSLEVANFLEIKSADFEKQGSHQEALDMAIQAQKIYKENKMSAGEFILLGIITDIHLKMSNQDAAIGSLEEHIELKEKINGINHPSTLSLHYKLASLYLHQNKYKEALAQYKQVLDCMKNNGVLENDKTAYLYYFLGLCNYNLSNQDEAKTYAYKALEAFEKVKDNKAIYRCCHLLGLIYEGKEDFNSSLIYLKKALIAVEEAFEDDSYELGLISYMIGKGEYRLNRVDEGIRYTNKALSVFRKNKEKHSKDIADAEYNLALMHYKKKEYDAALKYINQALDLYKTARNGDNLKVLLALENKAMMLQSVGHGCEALETFKQAISICDSFKDTKNIQIAKIYYNVASIYVEFYEDKIEEAKEYAQKALEIASNHKDLPFYKEAQTLFALTQTKKSK